MLDAVAFSALIKRKRGEKNLTQQALAEEIFGDPNRKGDISRIENGKVTPQEATIQKLKKALDISDAELDPIRTARPSAKQLDQIPTLSRDELELLAGRFEIDKPHDRTDAELREFLTLKAEEYRTYRDQIDAIDDRVAAVANLKGAAQDAAAKLDFDEVEDLLSRVDEVETQIAAETKEVRAANALLRNRPDDAFRILSAAADSFAGIDPLEPARRRFEYHLSVKKHGRRYGGDGLRISAHMIQDALKLVESTDDSRFWAMCQNSLGIALKEQGARMGGPAGAKLLSEAVTAYRAALSVRTPKEHPVQWATTQNNLGNALRIQGSRTDGTDGLEFLAKAVDAYRTALTVRKQEVHPVQWAQTQTNLGVALQELSVRTMDAEDVMPLLNDAITAIGSALEVRTLSDHPVDWAMTQEKLSRAELTRADHAATEDPAPHLAAALRHVENALTVYDRAHMPYDHGTATALRDDIKARLGG